METSLQSGFDVQKPLRKATSRAKSDVANKLVSMLLHEASRLVVANAGIQVSDRSYHEAVALAFGSACLYCGRPLEADKSAVEHLDGMNRFRVGLHVPGNVAISCKRCNLAKRASDQLQLLPSGTSGWEVFLSHTGIGCPAECKTCSHWKTVWPDQTERSLGLTQARQRITAFREPYRKVLELDPALSSALKAEVERLYRECQEFASKHLEKITSIFHPMSPSTSDATPLDQVEG